MPRTHLNKQNRKGRGRSQPESATSGTPEKRDAGHTAGKCRSRVARDLFPKCMGKSNRTHMVQTGTKVQRVVRFV